MAARSVGRNVAKWRSAASRTRARSPNSSAHRRTGKPQNVQAQGKRSRYWEKFRRRKYRRSSHSTLARLRGQSSGLFDFELGDHLRLAFVEDLKVLLVKIPDGVSLGVANHGAYHDQLYVHLERSGFVVRSELLRILLTFGLRGRTGGGSGLRTILGQCNRRGKRKNQTAHARQQGNKFRTKKRLFIARLMIVRLASGELLIKTPAIAGGRQGVPRSRRTPLVEIPFGPRMLPNSVHLSRPPCEG